MIDRTHELSLSKQAKILKISRGIIYYEPEPTSADDLAIMRRIDELHMELPFAGSRMLRDLLAAEGSRMGRRHVTTLMQKMGIEAVYRRPNTSKPAVGHKIYPYLLRTLAVERPNRVWAMDVTYIAMARGFIYLAAVVDWCARGIATPCHDHVQLAPGVGRTTARTVMSYLAKAEVFSGLITRPSLSWAADRMVSERKKPGRGRNG